MDRLGPSHDPLTTDRVWDSLASAEISRIDEDLTRGRVRLRNQKLRK
jgi:hypothetical protein